MPAWKHMYKPAEIDSIIAYIKTVPAPAPAPQPAAQNR
jgi:mono/diheme cytochrome c family protein